MMQSRDGDSDDYDYVVTEMWGKTKRKMGFGEDTEQMQADIAMFLSVWKKKAEEALPDAGEDEEAKKKQAEQVSAQFKAHCMEILENPDLHAIFENSLSERDRMKMLLLIGDGGKLTGAHQVMVDVTGMGTQDGILDNIKAMSDAERAAAVKDPTFMLRVIHDLSGKERKAALAYLHGSKATDGLVDAKHTLKASSWGGVDKNAAMESVLGLDKEALKALSMDNVQMAELTKGLGAKKGAPKDGNFEDQGQLFQAMMAEIRGLDETVEEGAHDADVRDLYAATGKVDEKGEQAIMDRNAAIVETREWLHIQHKYALLNASFGGAEGLAKAASAAYSERGEMADPADEKVKLYVWSQAARDRLWAEISTEIMDTWGKQSINMVENLASMRSEGTMLGVALSAFLFTGMLGTGGMVALGGAMESAEDMDGNALKGTWGTVVRDAVLGDQDPTAITIAKQQEISRDKDGILASIKGAGSKMVIEDWSNIDRPGTNGKSLKDVWKVWMDARKAHQTLGDSGKASPEELQEAKFAADMAKKSYIGFTVSYNERVTNFLNDEWPGFMGNFTGAGQGEMLEYKEALLDRILAVSPEEIAAHFGMGSFVEDELTGVATFQRDDSYSEDDVSSLMGTDRKARAKHAITKEKVLHQIEDNSLVNLYSDKKAAIGSTYGEYSSAYHDARSQTEEQKEKGELGDITDEEAKELEPLLAAVGSSISEYKAEKTKLANRMKMVVATVLSVVTALVSGPGGPTLIASLLLGAAEAGANVLIDEMCQGNDYDGLKEIGPALAKSVGQTLLTHGMDKGFESLANAWPKQAAYLQENPFTNFLGDTKKWVEGKPGGKILVKAFQKGIVAPAVDTVTAPLLHLIDPNELKWGTQSAQQEAWQMFQAKLAALPKKMWIKTMAALKDGGKEALLKAMFKEKDKTGDLPGVKLDEKKLPKDADLMASLKKCAGKKWTDAVKNIKDQASLKSLKKEALTFLVETGALVLEGGDVQKTLEDQAKGSVIGKGLNGVQGMLNFLKDMPDKDAGDWFDVLYPHFDGLVTATAEDYVKTRNAKAAHDFLEANKDKVDQLDLPATVKKEEAAAFFAHYIKNDAKGASFTDADFEAFKNGRWKQIAAKLKATETITDAGAREDYIAWLMEDPESFDERCTQKTKFLKNRKKGDDHRREQLHLIHQASMGEDQKQYALAMLSDDKKAGELFDFVTGEGKTPDLGDADGMKSFKASYVKMKQDAVIAAVDTYEKSKKWQTRWVQFVRGISSPWEWNSKYPFDPNADASAAGRTIARDFFNSLDGKERTELSEALYGPKPKSAYHVPPPNTEPIRG